DQNRRDAFADRAGHSCDSAGKGVDLWRGRPGGRGSGGSTAGGGGFLRRGFGLPWQRVLGAGGAIKLQGDSAVEQRLRLESEGVRFRGRRVDMKVCEWKFGRASK